MARAQVESLLCAEAYSYMGVVFEGWREAPGWKSVPECSPSALDGALYTVCGDCYPMQSPRFNHYVAPLIHRHA